MKLNTYDFADGNGYSIASGMRDLSEAEAHDYAQAAASARGIAVSYWLTGDRGKDGDEAPSLVWVDPQ